MQVTGYKLRAALKALELKLEAANRIFTDSLMKFPSEKKLTPDEAMAKVQEIEIAIAKIQAAQAEYNTKVSVEVLGNKMTLNQAVKRVGGAGRIVALWKKASGAVTVNQRYYHETPVYSERAREHDKEYAERQIGDLEATQRAVDAEKFASALRGAIAEGNGLSMEVDLDPKLLTE